MNLGYMYAFRRHGLPGACAAFLLLILLACLSLYSAQARALAYPDKPIRLIVPYPAGGATDVAARLLASEMSTRLGQPVVVENRPGAVGTLGAGFVAKQPADGYTLLFGGPGNLTLRPLMEPPISYDPVRDLATINHVITYDHLLVIRDGLGVNSIAELIKLAKSKPGALSYGSSGTGGPQHMAMELFKQMSGIDIRHIPYKGEAQVATDLVGGRIDMSIISTTAIGSYIKAGRVKVLAATNPYRSHTFPDIPTMSEAGVKGYEFESYGGVLAPAGTSPAIIEKLNETITSASKSPELKKKFEDASMFVVNRGPREYAKFLISERDKWRPIVKNAMVDQP